MSILTLKSTVSTLVLSLALGAALQQANADNIIYNGGLEEYNALNKVNKEPSVFPVPGSNNNTVTISDSNNLGAGYNAPSQVYGGVVGTGGAVVDLNNNKVTMFGGNVLKNVEGSHNESGGAASQSSVNISGGTIGGQVIGGTSLGGVASGNTVTMISGTVGGQVIGGLSTGTKSGIAKNNTVTVTGGSIGDEVIGGQSTTSDAIDNTVSIAGATLKTDLTGGYANAGNATGNTITVAGKANVEGIVIGGYVASGNGAASQNSITINGGVIGGQVMGGKVAGGIASQNKVMINVATINDNIYGGSSVNGDATGNSVALTGATANGKVYGGYTQSTKETAVVSGNAVTVSGVTNIDGDVYGGYAAVTVGSTKSGIVKNNSVTLTGGTVTGVVTGGQSAANDAVSNTVSVTDATLKSDVSGGYANAGNATDNTVTIAGQASVGGNIAGGYVDSGNGSATQNSVTINGGTVAGEVFGGRVADGAVSQNKVIMSAGEVNNNIYGGYTDSTDTKSTVSGNTVTVSGTSTITGNVIAGFGRAGLVSDNTTTINGGILKGQVFGGNSISGAAENNKVTINGGTFGGNVYGGYTQGSGDATGNAVTITSGTLGGQVTGGWSTTGAATGNSISISNATVTGNDTAIGYVVAGYVDKIGEDGSSSDASNNVINLSSGAYITGAVISGLSRNGDATGNSITMKDDAIVDGNIYGGYSTDGGSATNNTITLEGSELTIGGGIYGGYLLPTARDASSSADGFTGNTLNLNGFTGSVQGIYNVENYNWLLPKYVVNGDTLITITGDTPVDLTGTHHSVAMVNDGNVLNVGDTVTLIDKVANTPVIPDMEVSQGTFLLYNVGIAQQNGDQLVLTVKAQDDKTPTTPPVDGDGNPTTPTTPTGGGNVTKPGAYINPRTKAFSEGRAVALGVTNQGADLIADAGIRAARASVATSGSNGQTINLVPFVVMNGSSLTYKTGSHADVNSFNVATGLASGFDFMGGHQATVGAFFEYGRGTYDGYNSFTNYASVHSDGSTHYTGGGILGRVDFAGTGLGRVTNLAPDQADGLYVEASLRAGKVHSDFESDDLKTGYGMGTSYNSSSTYYGAHGNVGYVFNFDERNALDVYGRYLWTRMDSDSVTIGGIDRLNFDASKSSRIRIGGRYNYTYSEQIKPYLGASYEHEFEGKISANAYNLSLAEPSLKGDTGVFEAGVSLSPLQNQKISVDINGQGYAGRRQGGGGGLKIKYEF